MENRCRLCGEVSLELIPILEDLEHPNKIYQLFQVKVNLEDQLPTLSCKTCWEMIDSIWESFIKVQKAQTFLTQILQSELQNCVETLENGHLNFADDSNKIIENVDSNKQILDAEILSTEAISAKESTDEETTSKTSSLDDHLPETSISNYNQDGSIVPKHDLNGWDTYPWTCCDCHQTAGNSEELRDHFLNEHDQMAKYSCADCHKIYAKYTTFLAHVKSHRAFLKFCCDLCSQWFPNLQTLDKHRSEHSSELRHACAHCGKRFKTQSSLWGHARTHLPFELKNKYQCDQCPKRFGTKPNLLAHKRIHSGIKNYKCEQCGKCFFQKGNLDNHMLTHVMARPYSCATCGKTFKTSVRLKKHSSIHSGLKPHQCDICGRRFRERGTLKEHHRIHTGAMPFTCEFCGKSFRFKGVLTTHLRQHTGERPYSCQECQHHFTNWPNYNKHMKRRHGINTSVTVRKPQTIPPTGRPHRNPPGTVLAPPLPLEPYEEHMHTTFFPVLNLYSVSEDILEHTE